MEMVERPIVYKRAIEMFAAIRTEIGDNAVSTGTYLKIVLFQGARLRFLCVQLLCFENVVDPHLCFSTELPNTLYCGPYGRTLRRTSMVALRQ